ncbi:MULTISPECIES: 4-(cytidine 5'-diphospho)-2-C-methyl-D-erythritol kinase [Martelella]|uniref:4-diphosphocytidyl-2-C-methyl-D-erythritol kinase n=1 Tax=Martelella mediterranea DSM 17316 TaxID=1122214 RepID=A0A1U9Z1C1_9HYPH|nr:4-(cytidine 5'-diphospho)-2-C-methyl-D-erythritol kinase [Martelella mediterranea]AQZ51496.1 4-diphosphocytidyl-2-C-methyl-D-erythritol kinase [Martelella mediterranea DSM 17316]
MTTADGAALTVDARAKINLALHVTGRRGDGYHLLDTLVTFATFGDRLTFAEADADRFTLSGRFADAVPRGDEPDRGNLVLKARNLLREYAEAEGFSATPVHIHLEKQLPPASGIGGGSADAAATLRGLARLWRLPGEIPAPLALSLGADVPMCLAGKPLFARGIGDAITPAIGFPRLFLVLVNPLHQVATPEVFGALEHRDNSPILDGDMPQRAEDWLALIKSARNDLQFPASRIAPVIFAVTDALAATGAELVRMSGSGATCFGLYPDLASAEIAARNLAAAYPDWFVVATTTISSGDAA